MENDSSFSMHDRNTQTLVIETFIFLNGLHPQMTEIFRDKPLAPHSLKDKNELALEILEI